MATDRPDPESDPAAGDLARLYGLAERIATEIGHAECDWCAIARDARELAAGAEARRQQ
jgi:hypothetical protein